jgi:hypothetical protein
VYSFGVLLLEIICGRKAVDFDPELGEHYLVEKVLLFFTSCKQQSLSYKIEYALYIIGQRLVIYLFFMKI